MTRTLVALVLATALLPVSPASAGGSDGTKGGATPVGPLPSAFPFTSSTAASGADTDYFLVSTPPAGLILQRHELVVTPAGSASITGQIRGLNQNGTVPTCAPWTPGSGGVAGTADVLVQSSSTTAPRKNVWYGFGQSEQIYYRVDSTTTAPDTYTVALTSTNLSPTAIPGGVFKPGLITITTVGQTSADTEIHLLQNAGGTFVPMPCASNDDTACPFGAQAELKRHLCASEIIPSGMERYVIAISDWHVASHLASPNDEGTPNSALMDFPGVFACSSPAFPVNCSFSISDGTNTVLVPATKSSPYEILWFEFTVDGTLDPITSLCHPGEEGVIVCPCSNPPGAHGRGCNNSNNTGGALLSGSGNAVVGSFPVDSLLLSAIRELPNATTIAMQGNLIVGSGVAFGAGVRCTGAPLKRMYVKNAVGGAVTVPSPGDLSISDRSAQAGDPIMPGTNRTYLFYYRDPAGVIFCPAGSTFNCTQAVCVYWQ